MGESMELLEYWRIVAKRKWIILLLFVAAVVGAYVASDLVTPIYEASTTILIEDNQNVLPLPILEGTTTSASNAVQNSVEVLKSRVLAETTASRVGLQLDPLSTAFTRFRQSISVRPIQGTDAIRISVQNADPALAQKIANTLVESFVTQTLDANRLEARSAREFIDGQLSVVERDLQQAEETLRVYKQREGIVAPSEQTQAVIDQIAALEKARAEANVALQESQRQLEEIRQAMSKEEPTLVASTTITNNPMVNGYRQQLADLEAQLAAALETYTEKHPQVIRLRAQIEEVNQKLSNEAAKIVSAETHTQNPVYQGLVQQAIAAQIQQVSLEARVKALEGLAQKAEQSFSNLPDKELQLARLTRDAQVSEQIYLMLRQKNEEFRIQEAQKTPNVRVIDPALRPVEPVKPKKKLNIAIAGFLGLFVGCGLAFVFEFLDTTIRTRQEVEAQLGLPVIGQIPEFTVVSRRAASNGKHASVSYRGRG